MRGLAQFAKLTTKDTKEHKEKLDGISSWNFVSFVVSVLFLRFMLSAAGPRMADHSWLSADFATGSSFVSRHIARIQRNVFAADVIRGKQRYKRRRQRSFFYIRPASRFFPFHQAHHTHDFEAKFARRFDRLNRGRPRRANIIHNHHPRPFFPEAFDALPHAMLLFSFADEESINFAADHRDRNDDGVGAHGQAADGRGFPSSLDDFVEKDLPGQLRATRVERSEAAVNVVVARAARRQFEFSEAERFRRKQS